MGYSEVHRGYGFYQETLCVLHYVVSQKYLITYESLVQEATREYRDLVDSKRWALATRKETSKDKPSLPKSYNMVIEQSINKYFKQVYFKSLRSGNVSGSGRGSSDRSDITYHKCGKWDIYKNTVGQREISLVRTHPRILQMSFQNG